MGAKVSVQINGVARDVVEGTRILDYLNAEGIQHPHI